MESKIKKNLSELEKSIQGGKARLLPVSKTFLPELIMEAYEAGYREFGENRVQEILEKRDKLPADIQWHLIGHLQSNKVKYIADFIALIQSVDSEKLLQEIEKQAIKAGRQIAVLLQVHIAEEEHKSGWDRAELLAWMLDGGPARFPNVLFRGLMGLATNTQDKDKVRYEFRGLAELKKEIDARITYPNVKMEELSMGMSQDYETALEEGSTMVRMGTAVFGGR
jgi:pyridoxal phosphate enzyme (YggS family)